MLNTKKVLQFPFVDPSVLDSEKPYTVMTAKALKRELKKSVIFARYPF